MEIKQNPEDFIVKEIINLNKREFKKPGRYLYVQLTKKNWNTLNAINKIKEKLHIPRKYIGFAGSKDKYAITTQYISIFGVKKERVLGIKIKDIALIPHHYGSKPISLGDLQGNYFEIKLNKKIKSPLWQTKTKFLANYFGEQRFGKNNAGIGKAILLKDFKKACSLIGSRNVTKHLLDHKNDFIGALRCLDKKLLSLYINSVQSLLWNKVAAEYIEESYPNHRKLSNLIFTDKIKKEDAKLNIPLFSFDIEFNEKNKKIEKMYNQILKQEGLTKEDFIIRVLPDITPLLTERPLFVQVKDFKIKGNWISFFLPKGSYATTLINYLETLILRFEI